MGFSSSRKSVLFVCLGNICRSPTAEAVFRDLLERYGGNFRVDVDSAGTHAYHAGSAPDARAVAAAARRGIDMRGIRARKITAGDFQHYDLLLAMDEQVYWQLLEVAPAAQRDRVRLFLEYAPHLDRREVPDPFAGGAAGFEEALDLIEAGARGLLAALAPPA